jgi:hypothetical protein
LIVVACLGSINLMAHRTADSFDASATELAGVFAS